MGFLAQKVEHQRTKLKVAGSSPAATEVHFFSYPKNAALFGQTRLLGFGFPGLKYPLYQRVVVTV